MRANVGFSRANVMVMRANVMHCFEQCKWLISLEMASTSETSI
jgi:hypothetical protein